MPSISHPSSPLDPFPASRTASEWPRWTQTCADGHLTVARAPSRPTRCHCGAEYPPVIATGGSLGRKATSGEGALHTYGGKY